MARHTVDPGFAPDDPSDGRQAGEWRTRYCDPEAQKAIRFEGTYVACLLFVCPLLLLVMWLSPLVAVHSLEDERCSVLCRYAFAWVGGLLGGTLYTMKWLYHVVARGSWHRDRRLWRLLAPHLSAALAFVFVCMVESGILLVFDRDVTRRPSAVVAMAFLVGYFSDTALAKMSEIAISLFGTVGKATTRPESDERKVEGSGRNGDQPR